MLFYGAGLRGFDDRAFIFLREISGKQDFDVDVVDEVRRIVPDHCLRQPDIVRGNAPRLAKGNNIKTRARADGRKEQLKRPRRGILASVGHGLVGAYRKAPDPRVHLFSAPERDFIFHVHDFSPPVGSSVIVNQLYLAGSFLIIPKINFAGRDQNLKG